MISEAAHIKRSCTDKQRYATDMMAKMAAKRHIIRSQRHHRKSTIRDRLWIYPCDHCAGWHITKRISGFDCVEL